jgi:hypothetical protein
MTRRSIGLALLFASASMAGDKKWTFAQLVDSPLAPADRKPDGKILKVSAAVGPAADGDVQHAVAMIPADQPKSAHVVKTSVDLPAKIAEEPKAERQPTPAPQTWRVFVGGEVARPGAFNGQKPFTALQAVIAAGGLKDGGKATEIVVLRYVQKDAAPTVKKVDLSASLAGKGTNDLWLESHDVVIVPKAGAPTSTEEIISALPIPIANAAKSRLVEIHRIKADADEVLKAPAPMVLPSR